MSCDGPHLFNASYTPRLGFPGGSAVRNLPTNAEDSGDMDSILESGRSPGEGNDNLLQYSCLGNPTDRRLVGYIVHEVAKELDMT